MSRLRLANAMAPDVAADAGRALARWLRPFFDELGAVESREEELVDVAKVLPLPRRQVYAACRSGAIGGASRVGRRWLATRAAVDAWVRSRGPSLVRSVAVEADDLEETRRRLTTPGRRKRAG